MATMEELADKVAHATTGKDVRGAIAEGFGQFDQVKGEVFRRVKAVEDDNAALNQRDQALEDRISQSEERLTKRIVALEDMLFGQRPQEVKMAENSTLPVNGGAMLVNLTNTDEEDK